MRFSDRHLVGGAAAACAACCAAPVVGLLGVAGFAATAATLAFAGVVFAIVVGVASLATVLVRRSRRRTVIGEAPMGSAPVEVELGPTRTASTR